MSVALALSRVLVDELARAGVVAALVAPGSRSTPLTVALDEDPRIRVHVGIDERAAAFVALGVAKASGRPAVVVTTSGTATANLHPAVVEADASRTPLIVCTADRPPELRHTAANQTIDQLKLFGAAVRWFVEVGVPEDHAAANAYWRATAARAVADATGSPPGPVHLNLAFREPFLTGPPPTHPLDGRPDGRPWTAVTVGPRVPSGVQLAEVARRVGHARRGLLVCGDGLADPAAMVALAEHLSWPLVAEPLSGARVGDHAVSTAHALVSHGPFAQAHRPDLVVRVGRVGLSKGLLALLDAGTPQVLIDPHGGWLDPTRAVCDLLVADPALVAAGLLDRLPGSADRGWLDGWRAAEAVARRAIDQLLDADERPSELRTARDVAAAVPEDTTLVAASSMPVRDLDTVMAPRRLRVLGNRGASGIDGFVSTALGVALTGPTVALAGDLSLLHDQAGFLLADRSSAPLTIVVVNNDGGGIFGFLPQAGSLPADRFERLLATPHGRDLAHLAGLYDLAYERVERASQLPAAVPPASGVRLVEVRTDRADTVALRQRLLAEVAAALEAML